MAAWLSSRLVKRKCSSLLPCPISLPPVCSRGVARVSPASGALSTIQEKPRTVEDLPHVSFLEFLCRVVFQGFYKRMHELQVGCSAWSLLCSLTVIRACFSSSPNMFCVLNLMHFRNSGDRFDHLRAHGFTSDCIFLQWQYIIENVGLVVLLCFHSYLQTVSACLTANLHRIMCCFLSLRNPAHTNPWHLITDSLNITYAF